METLSEILTDPSGERYLAFIQPAGISGSWQWEVEVAPGTLFLSITVADEQPQPARAAGVDLVIESPNGTFGTARAPVEGGPESNLIERTTDHGYAWIANHPAAGAWRIRLSAQNASAFAMRLQTFTEVPESAAGVRTRSVLHARAMSTEPRLLPITPERISGRQSPGLPPGLHNAITDPSSPEILSISLRKGCADCQALVTYALAATSIFIVVVAAGVAIVSAGTPVVLALATLLLLLGVGIGIAALVDALRFIGTPEGNFDGITFRICKAAGLCF
ncbi:MAG TPA: hypothetical protein VF698_01785 [Thermoanaerobaculia bacterium]|jgi:hypothetical protein